MSAKSEHISRWRPSEQFREGWDRVFRNQLRYAEQRALRGLQESKTLRELLDELEGHRDE